MTQKCTVGSRGWWLAGVLALLTYVLVLVGVDVDVLPSSLVVVDDRLRLLVERFQAAPELIRGVVGAAHEWLPRHVVLRRHLRWVGENIVAASRRRVDPPALGNKTNRREYMLNTLSVGHRCFACGTTRSWTNREGKENACVVIQVDGVTKTRRYCLRPPPLPAENASSRSKHGPG